MRSKFSLVFVQMDLGPGSGGMVHKLLQPFKEERLKFRMRNLELKVRKKICVCKVGKQNGQDWQRRKVRTRPRRPA